MGKNALIVDLVIKNRELEAESSKQANGLSRAEVRIYALEDEIKDLQQARARALAAVAAKDDEFWASKAEVTRLQDRIYNQRDSALAWELAKKSGWITVPEVIEPFGVDDGKLVDPMVGNKIPTIKLIRVMLNLGLKESKDIVDGWQAKGLFRNPLSEEVK